MAFTPFKKKRDYSTMPDAPMDDEKDPKKKGKVPPVTSPAPTTDDSSMDDSSMDDGEDDGNQRDMAESDEGGQEGTLDDPDYADENGEGAPDLDTPEDDEGGAKQTASFALVRREGETCGSCENYEGGEMSYAGPGDTDEAGSSGKCQVVAGQFSPQDSCGRFYMPKMGGDEMDSMHVPAGGHPTGGGMTGGQPSANGGGRFHGLPEPPLR